MKLSFGIIVLNGEPFIKYNLENLYPHAHEILIVEGAVERFAHAATSDGHSIDNTVQIIKDFPDPESKIKLIQRNGFWPEKDEMCNAYMEVCTGDYIWQVDVDEFYKPEDIEVVRQILKDDPLVTRVDFISVGFWRGFDAVMKGATLGLGADEFIRIFKFKPEYRYKTHRPPTLMDEHGHGCNHSKIISANQLREQFGIVQYHYSYVFPQGVTSKSHYYSKMGWGKGCNDGLKWAESCWQRLNNPLRIHLIDFPPSWIVPFDGTHPNVITKMIENVGFKEDDEHKKFLHAEWKTYSEIGEKILKVCKQVGRGGISNVIAAIKILGTLRSPVNVRLVNSDITIIKTAIKVLLFKGKS